MFPGAYTDYLEFLSQKAMHSPLSHPLYESHFPWLSVIRPRKTQSISDFHVYTTCIKVVEEYRWVTYGMHYKGNHDSKYIFCLHSLCKEVWECQEQHKGWLRWSNAGYPHCLDTKQMSRKVPLELCQPPVLLILLHRENFHHCSLILFSRCGGKTRNVNHWILPLILQSSSYQLSLSSILLIKAGLSNYWKSHLHANSTEAHHGILHYVAVSWSKNAYAQSNLRPASQVEI